MVGINNPRTQIAIPAQGIQELKGILTNLIEEFGNEDDRGNHHIEISAVAECLPEFCRLIFFFL